jgi:acyl carrier protein phosphodiesterase
MIPSSLISADERQTSPVIVSRKPQADWFLVAYIFIRILAHASLETIFRASSYVTSKHSFAYHLRTHSSLPLGAVFAYHCTHWHWRQLARDTPLGPFLSYRCHQRRPPETCCARMGQLFSGRRRRHSLRTVRRAKRHLNRLNHRRDVQDGATRRRRQLHRYQRLIESSLDRFSLFLLSRFSIWALFPPPRGARWGTGVCWLKLRWGRCTFKS